jgi:hypothetical protein
MLLLHSSLSIPGNVQWLEWYTNNSQFAIPLLQDDSQHR